MKQHMAVLVIGVALAACGPGGEGAASAPDAGAADAGNAASPGGGMPAEGGLTVEEAKASDLDGPLVVQGSLIAVGDEVRLCQALLESFPPQCGGASLVVEGLDLSTYDLRRDGDVAWSESSVSLLGEVEGDRLRVSDTAI